MNRSVLLREEFERGLWALRPDNIVWFLPDSKQVHGAVIEVLRTYARYEQFCGPVVSETSVRDLAGMARWDLRNGGLTRLELKKRQQLLALKSCEMADVFGQVFRAVVTWLCRAGPVPRSTRWALAH